MLCPPVRFSGRSTTTELEVVFRDAALIASCGAIDGNADASRLPRDRGLVEVTPDEIRSRILSRDRIVMPTSMPSTSELVKPVSGLKESTRPYFLYDGRRTSASCTPAHRATGAGREFQASTRAGRNHRAIDRARLQAARPTPRSRARCRMASGPTCSDRNPDRSNSGRSSIAAAPASRSARSGNSSVPC